MKFHTISDSNTRLFCEIGKKIRNVAFWFSEELWLVDDKHVQAGSQRLDLYRDQS